MFWPVLPRLPLPLLGLLLCAACGETQDPPVGEPARPPSGEPAADQQVWANVAPARVEEALSGDGRSYLRIRESVYEFWVSVPAQPFQVGDLVLLGKGPLQKQVRSEALGRSFDVMTRIESVLRLSPEESERYFGISPVEGGLSVAQLYAERAGLAGKPIKVRGRITKISRGIFGKDWIHIQDGSRGPGEGQDELTANTEQCPAEVGDVVVVEGPLTVDLDLGFGYFYAAILENATVSLEGAAPPSPAPAPVALAPTPVADSPPAMVSDPGATPTLASPPSGPPAPTRSLYGLRLGGSADPEINAWLAERGLTCKAGPAPARTTFQYRCSGPLPVKTLPDRKIGGQLSDVLLARLENGPLHHVSSQRRYSLPTDVLVDYHSALDSLITVLGPPEKESRVEDPARLNAKALRIASRWRFADLEVVLSIFRGAGDYFAVNEVWTVPGAEALAKDRGGGAHGGGSRGRPVGWSPHVLADE